MNWTEKISTWKRNGIPAKSYEAVTPLMTFRVYESVSGGSFFYYHTKETNGWRDPYNDFGNPKHKCKSFEDGMKICDEYWNKLKEAVLNC